MAVFDLSPDRRTFLKVSAVGGGLMIFAPQLSGAKPAEAEGDGQIGLYVKINSDNSVIIGSPGSEIGQGTQTSLPMLVAEELDVDFAAVETELMPFLTGAGENGRPQQLAFTSGAGGSDAIWGSYDGARQAGAAARHLILRAAARRFDVPVAALSTEKGTVRHAASGRSLTYGELAADAARESLPEGELPLKERRDHTIIGKPQKHKDVRAIVTGEPRFGIDQDYPGALHAVIARSPYLDGRVRNVDDSAARAMPGVRHIVAIARPGPGENPALNNLAAGVAVVADSLWIAMKARDALRIDWAPGPVREDSRAEYAKAYEALKGRGQVVHEDGAFDRALDQAAQVVEAQYEVPLVSHSPLEPQNCIADIRGDCVTIIAPTQSPGRAARLVAEIAGVDPLSVEVRVVRCGGGFGRRLYQDPVVEAALISKAIGKPVKLQWSREDDMAHDFYRPGGIHHMIAGLDGNGRVTAWAHRLASHSRIFREADAAEGFWRSELVPDDFPGQLIPNYRMEYFYLPSAAPRGFWRAPISTSNAFAVQSFVDEVAAASGQDPLGLRLALLGDQMRDIRYDNHGGPNWNPGRMANVVKKAAAEAGWGENLPGGKGRGLAFHFTFGTYVAQIADVTVQSNGSFKVERVVAAADCGIPVNPNGIRAQMEGGVNDALSTALGQEITIRDGQVEQANFDTYDMMRIDRSVANVDMHIVESGGPVRGMGEPPVPPLAPAVTNALFNATGKRIRKLPIRDQLRS